MYRAKDFSTENHKIHRHRAVDVKERNGKMCPKEVEEMKQSTDQDSDAKES